jgi:urease accessory protein
MNPEPQPQRADGRLALAFRAAAGRTVLADLYQANPCRALFPQVETDEPVHAVMVNTAGGLVGGDRISTAVTLGPDTAATLTTQAAEKVYRSLGADCTVTATLAAADGAALEWLPQETILFEGARLDRCLTIALAPTASLLAAETVLFGRAARGERLTYGHLHDSWAIRSGGRLVWADAIRLSGDLAAARARPFGFGNAAGYATLVAAGPGVAGQLETARAIAAGSGAAQAGATVVGGILLLRLMDADGAALRRAVAVAAIVLRQRLFGRPARLPRAWSV